MRRFLPESWRLRLLLSLLALPLAVALLFWPRWGGPHSAPEVVWGAKGSQDGDFIKPRAVAIDREGRVFVVDFTARVQVFDGDGNLQYPAWHTPDWANGRPSGLSIDRRGRLLLSDSHYHCLRIYTPDGKEIRKIGGDYGSEPGQLAYISDAVQDEEGYFYIAEFGLNERITKLTEDGEFVATWGSKGLEPGAFNRIRALALGPKDGLLYAANACNHRIEVYTRDGKLVRWWGGEGPEPGQLRYPYDLAFNADGDSLYVVEHGNHRVQKFTTDGKSLGCWGEPGREPGQLDSPWGLAVDKSGRVFVLDSLNNRVQRIRF